MQIPDEYIKNLIKDALESVIPFSKEDWIGNEDYKQGWEECREQINQNIKNTIY